jgi:hypothetical protein
MQLRQSGHQLGLKDNDPQTIIVSLMAGAHQPCALRLREVKSAVPSVRIGVKLGLRLATSRLEENWVCGGPR